MRYSIIKTHKALFTISLGMTILGFAATFAHAQDGLDDGPGIFSGNADGISLSDLIKKERTSNKDKNVQESIGGNQPSTAGISGVDQYTEFELFKEWKRAKSSQSSDYQEFSLWVEYKLWKQDQE